ncbi:NAD-dependent epimerase/dehydratase family protein [Hydrogenophaga sp. RWCD_12]|uniref:NAD-dependent epimerase/dehydratase family protein n=1 Tax=Hydrogenophaga sp. RWCD_12 TaxID=3391190 RepID=UPI003984F1AC
MSTHHSSSSAPGSGDLHTVLGAGGVIARELTASLRAQGVRVRLASRRAHPAPEGVESTTADLLDASAVDRAVAGSAVVHLVAGLRYDTAVWQAEWPRVMANTIEACLRHGARLVFLDNVYAYGRVQGPMTEDTPFNPCSRKGEVRAAIATTLLDAVRRNGLTAQIARSADFYGPGATNSLIESVVVSRLQVGKTPQWVGNPRAVHTFTYTPDAGAALARLALEPSAWGQTWHLPTSAEAMTGEQLVRLANELAGRPHRMQVAPRWLLRVMGWFVPILRENDEMMYQFEHDYRFDSRKIERAFGLRATDYREGLQRTLASVG